MCISALSKCYLKWGVILSEVLPEVRFYFNPNPANMENMVSS